MIKFNLIAYCIYLPITFYITVYVGRKLFKSGEPFLIDAFHGNTQMAHSYNLFLLTGYYLVNLGYAAFSISGWDKIITVAQLIEDISSHLGLLVLLLGIMHYINMYSFSKFSKQLKNLYQNINHTNH